MIARARALLSATRTNTEIVTVLDIAAPPMRVWRALIDFQGYMRWNPYRHVEGTAALGEPIKLWIGPKPETRRATDAVITVFEPGRMLEMRSGRFGVARAVERWTIESGPRGARLHHRAHVEGIAAPLLRGVTLGADLERIYAQMDEALARHVTRGMQPKPRQGAGRPPRSGKMRRHGEPG